jgi:alpha-tubulin suppressor-like RCC1 family protein
VRALAIWTLLLLFALGCNETATQVLVVFEADPGKASRATSLRVVIAPVGADAPVYDGSHAVPSELTFPATVPVVPAGGDASRRFVAVGELSDETGVFDRLNSGEIGFTEGEVIEVVLRFEDEAADSGVLDGGGEDSALDGAPDSGGCGPCPCESDVCSEGVCVPATPVAQISAGTTHTCARTEDGRIFCWGDNTTGQLGLGDLEERLTPNEISGLSAIVDLDVGNGFACVVRDDGVILCWGRGGNYLSTTCCDDVLEPLEIDNPEAVLFSDVEAGGRHTCARTRSDVLYCWGAGDQGQNGRNGTAGRQPRRVANNATSWLSLDAGDEHTCGLRMIDIYCFGDNSEGQVAQDSSVTDQLTPARVASGESYRAVGLGRDHSCAITFDDRLFCFGRNNNLQTGRTGGDVRGPRQVGTDMDWSVVTGGNEHTCGIRGSGDLYCWGDNSAGQGGRDPSPATEVPTRVGTESDWVSVDGGALYTCGIREGGAVHCWGQNSAGQLGVGDRSARSTPTRVCLD